MGENIKITKKMWSIQRVISSQSKLLAIAREHALKGIISFSSVAEPKPQRIAKSMASSDLGLSRRYIYRKNKLKSDN